jgi:putative FmdB family regulatory protein
MPTYTYVCGYCGHGPEDRLVPIAKRAEQRCSKCGQRMRRRISAPAVRTRPPKDGGPDRFTADMLGIPLKELPLGLRTKERKP